MGPKPKPTSNLLKENVVIQAVLIADSFEDQYDVFTQERPKALIPLLNQPLIDYSLGLLKYNGVQEVFLFCSRHQKQVRDHVKQFWSNNSEMVVHVFSSDAYLSPGDVFRDLDAKALIKGEFILIHGDVVGNISLMSFLDEHKARKSADKGCIMSSIFCKRSVSHGNMIGTKEVVAITDLAGKIVGYESGAEDKKKIKISLDLFRDNSGIRLRKDIQDTHISICAVNMLMSFSENVDHQSMDDFIRGTLVDQEIHGNSVYISIAENGYGGRVLSPRDYHMISQDLICRWNHPVVPEKFLGCCKKRNNVYVHKSNKGDLVRCSLEKNVLIGSSTSLGSNVVMRNSVIGSNCKIGNNVILDGAYIWNDVEIRDGCVLTSSIIADNVVIRDGVKLRRGCLIGPSVIVDKNISLKNVSIVNCKPNESNKKLVGDNGRGSKHEADIEEIVKTKNLWEPDEEVIIKTIVDDERDSDSSESDLEPHNDEDDVKVFFRELIENFERGINEKISCDNLVLEVNSIKHAFNIPIDEVNVLVIQALLHLPDHMKGHFEGDYFSQLKSVFTFFLKLIKNYIKSSESQTICLRALEQFCLHRKDQLTTARLCKLIMFLYEEDILEDESILDWYSNIEPLPRLMVFDDDLPLLENQRNLRREEVLIKFIKWLEEAEEESESD